MSNPNEPHKCENHNCNNITTHLKYCSKSCQNIMQTKPKTKLVCPICGDVVYLAPWQVKENHDVTCGKKECRYKYRGMRFSGANHFRYKPKITVLCSYCGAPVTSHESQIKKRLGVNKVIFCSMKCKSKWLRIPGNSSTYIDGRSKIKNPYCEKFNEDLRNRVRAFFNYTCGWCGKPEREYLTKTGKPRKLNVHHVNYDKQVCCNGKPRLFIPLCASCHSKTGIKEHRKEWEAKFEKLLTEQYGGKCYYTREEYAELHPQTEP